MSLPRSTPHGIRQEAVSVAQRHHAPRIQPTPLAETPLRLDAAYLGFSAIDPRPSSIIMDPLSITAACVAMTTTIAKTSLSVTTFVRSVRVARSDLDGISRELASLATLLELIAEDTENVNALPETLRKQIAAILSNCQLVLLEVERLVKNCNGPGLIKGSKWTLAGSEDVTKLRLSLAANKSALEIALEMVTLDVIAHSYIRE
jgi:hypothetical protein